MTDNPIDSINDYLQAGKNAVDIIKTAIPLLPKGKNRDKALEEVARAEEAIRANNAVLAKSLGYHLCLCTFPPQIMLWDQARRHHACPNCGRIEGANRSPPSGGRDPNSWML